MESAPTIGVLTVIVGVDSISTLEYNIVKHFIYDYLF